MGVILYEMIFKEFPFDIKDTDDPELVYEKILINKLIIPDSISPRLKALIQGLLNDNPFERYGSEEINLAD